MGRIAESPCSMSTSCQECTPLMLSLLLAWTICLTNSQFAGDVTVMMPCFPCLSSADVSVVVLLIVFRLMGYFGVYRIRLCVNHVRLCVRQIRFYGLWQILSRTWMADVDDSQGKLISKCNKDAYPTQKLKKIYHLYIYLLSRLYWARHHMKLHGRHIRLDVRHNRLYGFWQMSSRIPVADIDDRLRKCIIKCSKDLYPTEILKIKDVCRLYLLGNISIITFTEGMIIRVLMKKIVSTEQCVRTQILVQCVRTQIFVEGGGERNSSKEPLNPMLFCTAKWWSAGCGDSINLPPSLTRCFHLWLCFWDHLLACVTFQAVTTSPTICWVPMGYRVRHFILTSR